MTTTVDTTTKEGSSFAATDSNNNNKKKNNDGSRPLQWSEIDKVKFYGIGTGMYSLLTIMLHPMSVLKIRQQMWNTTTTTTTTNTNTMPTISSIISSSNNNNNNALQQNRRQQQHQPSLIRTLQDTIKVKNGSRSSSGGIRALFRGAGIVVALAVPARAIYIGVLESSRQDVGNVLNKVMVAQSYGGEPHTTLPLVASLSGGIAGGLAALSAQVLVVPMDVISKKQIAMSNVNYERNGTAIQIIRNVIKNHGISNGLYCGFTISVLSSLPTGVFWWATYSGVQQFMSRFFVTTRTTESSLNNSYNNSNTNNNNRNTTYQWLANVSQRGIVQVVSGLSAAFVASIITQPLDVILTHLQVGDTSSSLSSSTTTTTKTKTPSSFLSKQMKPTMIAKEIIKTSGIRGLYRGLGPRTLHIGLWGTILSSAYELLRHVSRKS